MAKGTKKKSGAKSQMPKTVAGVKVPKEVRDFGGGIGSWLSSHVGREVMAEALLAAAGAAALALRRHAPSSDDVARTGKRMRRAARDAAETGGEAADLTRDLVQAAAGVVGDVVATGVQKLLPDAAADAPARRGRGRPRSNPVEAPTAEAAPMPRRRGPRAGRPAGAGPGPGRPRKQRPAESQPTPETPAD